MGWNNPEPDRPPPKIPPTVGLAFADDDDLVKEIGDTIAGLDATQAKQLREYLQQIGVE